MKWNLLAAVLILSGVGCSTPKDISGTVLPPRSPAEVMLYQSKPREYDIVGRIVVPVTAGMEPDRHGHATRLFEALKAKAAEMGANGVLFGDTREGPGVTVTAGYEGVYYQVPMFTAGEKVAVATAILVKPKSSMPPSK